VLVAERPCFLFFFLFFFGHECDAQPKETERTESINQHGHIMDKRRPSDNESDAKRIKLDDTMDGNLGVGMS